MSVRGKSITVEYYAWDVTNGIPKTGDAANHTLKWVKDGTSATATNAGAEVDATNAKGLYKVVLTAAECNCDFGTLHGVSSTSGVYITPVKVPFETGGVVTAGTATAAGTQTISLATGDGAKCALGNLLFIQSATTGAAQAQSIIKIATDVVTVDVPWATALTGTVTYLVLGTPQTSTLFTVQASGGNSPTSLLTDRTETDVNFWANGPWAEMLTGTQIGQIRKITAYDGAGKLTVNAFTTAPATGDIGRFVNY